MTTPVPVEGGVECGALRMSAGSSFHGHRKPNGSACQRRTMAASSWLSARRLLHGKGVRTDAVLHLAPAHRGGDGESARARGDQAPMAVVPRPFLR